MGVVFTTNDPQVVESTTENRFEANLWIVVDTKNSPQYYLWIHNLRGKILRYVEYPHDSSDPREVRRS